MRRRAVLAVGAASILALADCGGQGTGSAAGGTVRGSGTGLALEETFLANERKPGPTVTGELLDGTPFDVARWHGSVVVLNVWGSWCAPCRAEAPDLQATFTATQPLGVRFLGVDVRDDRDAAKAFLNAHQISYPSLFDPAGHILLDLRDVSPNVVPSTLLLDRRLRVAAVFRRRVTARELQAAVRALAGEGGD